MTLRADSHTEDAISIRAATVADAKCLIDLKSRLERDAEFLITSPVDPCTGVELVSAAIKNNVSSTLSNILVAEAGEALIGVALSRSHIHPAYRGVVQLDIGVEASHRRSGLGKQLVNRTLDWAEFNGVHRIQLAVVDANRPAIDLYHRCGFEIEGTLRRAVRINGTLHDVHVMARLLI